MPTFDDADLQEEVASHVTLAGEIPPERFPDELRSLLVSRIRLLHGRQRSQFLSLVDEGVIPTAFAGAVFSAVGREQDDGGAVTEQSQLREKSVRVSVEDDFTPEIVCVLRLFGCHVHFHNETAADYWLDHIGRLLTSADWANDPQPYENAANRWVRGAARARLRAGDLTFPER
jgi:hypothetical protein